MRHRWGLKARRSAKDLARAEPVTASASSAGFEGPSLTSSKSKAGGKKAKEIFRKLGRWLSRKGQ